MAGCDVVLNTTICGNSAVDKVASLVAEGMGLNEACKQVAVETDKKHGTTTKWATVKKKYQRANDLGTVSPPKKKKAPKIPIVDNTTTSCTECAAKDVKIAQLQEAYDFLQGEVDKLMLAQDEQMKLPRPGELKRETAITFIEKHGNKVQLAAITTQNPTNARLFGLFSVVRQQYLEKAPPQSLPAEIVEANTIVV